MLLLPVVFVVILYRYPAGLLVYWITTNLWTIVQQYVIRTRMPPPPKPETPVGGIERETDAIAQRSVRERYRGRRGPPCRGPPPRPARRVRAHPPGPRRHRPEEEEALGEATVMSGEEAIEDQATGGELEPREALEELLEEIVEASAWMPTIEVEEGDGVLTGRLEGEDVGLFIGRHGQTIDAVQHLAQRIVFPEGPSSVRVVIDANGYRERRADALRAEADEAAEDAVSSGKPVELDPLPPFERRIVHEYLRERGDVETHSEGNEPERYLVVSPLAGS